MPAVCCSLVVANLYTVVGVAVLQALNIGAGLAAQCFCEHTVFISQVCTGVGVLHVVTPGVQGGGCCASYALHYKGFVIAFDDLTPIYTVQIILALAVFIPVDGAQVLAYAGGGQSFGNLYLTAQIFAVCGMILIGNLLCQCLQGCFNSFLIGHSNAAAVGGQNYAGALVSLSNNGIAGLVVLNLVTFTIMVIDNGFPTAVMSDVQSFGSLGHVKEAFFSLGLAAVDGQACISCTLSHSQQGHACSFFAVSQLPGCTVCQPQSNAAVAVYIVAAGQRGALFGQVDYYAAAVCCIDIAGNSAGCFAAVYCNVAAVSIDAAVDSQCAVVAVNSYVSACACVYCCVGTVDNSAAVQGYIAVCRIDAGCTADIGVALNINVCTFCIDAGFALQLQLSLGGVDYDVFIGCTYCGAFFNLNLSRILSEYIRAVFLQDAVHLQLVIILSVTGNALVDYIAARFLSFRIGKARLQRTILQAAFTVFGAEGDIAGLHSLAACSQAVGNLHITGQVLLTVYEVAVCQLACQSIQYVSYAVCVIHCNAAVIGNHGYYRAFCRMLDNSVACCVVFSCFTVAGMCVEDVGVAAVVVDGQAVSILLEDVACFSIACTACKVGYMAAVE